MFDIHNIHPCRCCICRRFVHIGMTAEGACSKCRIVRKFSSPLQEESIHFFWRLSNQVILVICFNMLPCLTHYCSISVSEGVDKIDNYLGKSYRISAL